MTHSPAPWRIHVLTAGKDEAEILSALPDYEDCGVADVRYLADAALIAAAPELLIQCKNALSYMEVYNAMTPTIGQYELNIANSLRSVIAKAEQSQNFTTQTETK